MSYLDLINENAAVETVAVPAVFTATDMTTVVRNGCPADQGAVIDNGKCFRRLTPEYWAWFHHKYLLMEKALTNGKISEATFVEILDRISKLYNHATALYGKETLDEAVRTTDVHGLNEMIKSVRQPLPNETAHTKKARGHVPSLVVERGANTRG